MRWIAVNEKLPEKQIRVLVNPTNAPIVVGWIMWDEWYTDYGNGYGKLDITHWMPLPQSINKQN